MRGAQEYIRSLAPKHPKTDAMFKTLDTMDQIITKVATQLDTFAELVPTLKKDMSNTEFQEMKQKVASLAKDRADMERMTLKAHLDAGLFLDDKERRTFQRAIGGAIDDGSRLMRSVLHDLSKMESPAQLAKWLDTPGYGQFIDSYNSNRV